MRPPASEAPMDRHGFTLDMSSPGRSGIGSKSVVGEQRASGGGRSSDAAAEKGTLRDRGRSAHFKARFSGSAAVLVDELAVARSYAITVEGERDSARVKAVCVALVLLGCWSAGRCGLACFAKSRC